MKSKSSLLLVVLAAFTLPVLAQTATPKVDERQANQQKRIDQGVASGQLTGKEAARLEKGQERVQQMEDKAKFLAIEVNSVRSAVDDGESVAFADLDHASNLARILLSQRDKDENCRSSIGVCPPYAASGSAFSSPLSLNSSSFSMRRLSTM